MTSPSGTAPGKGARRRQRPVRLAIAGTLLMIAALLVGGAVLSGGWMPLTAAAGLGVLLGTAATRVTYTELADVRREAARDRAALAQDYREQALARAEEHRRYVAAVETRITAHQSTIAAQQEELVTARQETGEQTRRAEAAEREEARLASELAEARERLAEVSVHVAQLQRELDVLSAEWQAREVLVRRHA